MKMLKDKHFLLERNSNWLDDEPRWYMLYVRSGNLKRVTDELNRQDIFTYRPVSKKTADGKGNPYYVFPHYMFVHLSRKNLRFIPQTSERLNFVYRIDSPVFITDDELESMHVFLRQNSNAYVQESATADSVIHLSDYQEADEEVANNSRQLLIQSIDCMILSPFNTEVAPKRKYARLHEQLWYGLNSALIQLFGKTSARV